MNNHKDRTNDSSPSSKVQLSVTRHQSSVSVKVKHRMTTK